MEFFTLFALAISLVYDVVHGIRKGFAVFDIVVSCLVAAALVVNIAVLIRNRRK